MRLTCSCISILVLSAAGAISGIFAEESRGDPASRKPPLLSAARTTVGRFEKIEMDILCDAPFRNPYDPADVDLTVEIETPGGRRICLPAFWYQHHERQKMEGGGRRRDWIYPVGAPCWKARFAPTDTGAHFARARLRSAGTESISASLHFECVPSERKGFVRASAKDRRFLELTTGEPFFPVGQNLAFIGEGQHVTLAKAEEIFRKLSENGANYLRIWTCCEDWACAIEARKSAWGRSWSWDPPFAPLPEGDGTLRCVAISAAGRPSVEVSPSHAVALRPSTRYRISGRARADASAELRLELDPGVREAIVPKGSAGEWRLFEVEFVTRPDQRWLGRLLFRVEGGGTAWMDKLSLQEAGGGPEILWEADPNRPIPGTYNQLDACIVDRLVEAAEARGIYLQLCLITRDLYMRRLREEASAEYGAATEAAKRLLRYAVARWGCSTSVATWEYFNEMDPGMPTDRFYNELGEFLERMDPYRHLRATSAWHPSPRDWRHEKLDVADMHYYVRPADEAKHRSEIEALLGRARFLRESASGKPALLSEFGLATADWRLRPEMKKDEDLVHFHNAMWASALSGLSGTALFWWWEELDRMDVYPHYRGLSAFLAGTSFPDAGFETTAAAASPANLRLVGLQGRDRASIWLFDPRAAWLAAAGRGGGTEEIRGARVDVPGLHAGTYRVQWWDTRKGTVVREETIPVSPDGRLLVEAPPFHRDIACRVVEGLIPPAPR